LKIPEDVPGFFEHLREIARIQEKGSCEVSDFETVREALRRQKPYPGAHAALDRIEAEQVDLTAQRDHYQREFDRIEAEVERLRARVEYLESEDA
jgi:chromosome segregation ATPase